MEKDRPTKGFDRETVELNDPYERPVIREIVVFGEPHKTGCALVAADPES